MAITEIIALWAALIAAFVGLGHFAKAKNSKPREDRPEQPGNAAPKTAAASQFLFALAMVLCVALGILEWGHGQWPELPVIVFTGLGFVMASANRRRKRLR
jgi:hypothetical protein